jgi:hypothetical protein
MSHQLDEKRKEHLSNARNVQAEIEQYPDGYQNLSQQERRGLALETVNQNVYTDAFIFSKKKKNNAVPNAKNSIKIDKPARYINEQKKMKQIDKI